MPARAASSVFRLASASARCTSRAMLIAGPITRRALARNFVEYLLVGKVTGAPVSCFRNRRRVRNVVGPLFFACSSYKFHPLQNTMQPRFERPAQALRRQGERQHDSVTTSATTTQQPGSPWQLRCASAAGTAPPGHQRLPLHHPFILPPLPPVALAPASRGSSLLAGLGSSLPAFGSGSSLLLLPSPGRWSAMLTATFVGTNSSLLKLTES